MDEVARPIRIVTDVEVPQVGWWAERLSVMPTPRFHGPLGIWTALRLLWMARGSDVVITGNVRNGFALGLWKWLLRTRRPAHVMLEFRLDDDRDTALWRFKVRLQRLAFKTVDTICVSARREAEHYGARLHLPRSAFQFVPWHTNMLVPRRAPSPSGPVFSAGRTGRDWRVLGDAVKGLGYPVTVICTKDAQGAADFPPCVNVLTDVDYAGYRSELESARIVVIPLERHAYSSGQVVILEAMALGKPVVVTRVVGSEDYVIDGVTGLTVEPDSPDALRDAIQRILSDPELEDSLSRNALDQVVRDHTLQRYLERVMRISREVVERGRLPGITDRK